MLSTSFGVQATPPKQVNGCVDVVDVVCSHKVQICYWLEFDSNTFWIPVSGFGASKFWKASQLKPLTISLAFAHILKKKSDFF